MNKLLKNEQMFAGLNNDVTRIASALTPTEFPKDFAMDLYCECANTSCYERVSITHDQYKNAKNEGGFIVIPNHYLPEFEKIRTKAAQFWVIQKRPEKLGKDFTV